MAAMEPRSNDWEMAAAAAAAAAKRLSFLCDVCTWRARLRVL